MTQKLIRKALQIRFDECQSKCVEKNINYSAYKLIRVFGMHGYRWRWSNILEYCQIETGCKEIKNIIKMPISHLSKLIC